jgi:hypothetical protein
MKERKRTGRKREEKWPKTIMQIMGDDGMLLAHPLQSGPP